MWYYVENGEQKGPVSDQDLEGLQRLGKINAETLVWQEGMANWQAYGTIRPGAQAAGGAVPGAAGGGEVVCSECGKIFPASEVIRYGEASVCAACKPVFVQKLREGVKVGLPTLDYASFGTRFGAKFIDGLIQRVVQFGIAILAGLMLGILSGPGQSAGGTLVGIQIATSVGGILFVLLYNCFFLGRFGATPGKMLCKIKVVTPEGGPIGYKRAFLRPLAEIVSTLILFIGYLMAAWDDEKRTLHDRMCHTRVVKI